MKLVANALDIACKIFYLNLIYYACEKYGVLISCPYCAKTFEFKIVWVGYNRKKKTNLGNINIRIALHEEQLPWTDN